MRVKLTFPFDHPLLRQTPNSSGEWDGIKFDINNNRGKYDAWVVYESILERETVSCPPSRTIFIAGEPPEVRQYSRRFLSQFSVVVTCQPGIEHPNVLRRHQSLPWYAGVIFDRGRKVGSSQTYDTFKADELQGKLPLVSIVCSTKDITSGHRDRLDFVKYLRRELGESLIEYGHGGREIADKWSAIRPYQYHVVIENCRLDDYWTEKIADCFLGGALPFYCGCPNLGSYFPEQAYIPIDRLKPAESLRTIRTAIEVDSYAKARDQIAASRELVLDRFNLFAELASLVRSLPGSEPRSVVIKPETERRPLIQKLGRAVDACRNRILGSESAEWRHLGNRDGY